MTDEYNTDSYCHLSSTVLCLNQPFDNDCHNVRGCRRKVLRRMRM